MLEVRLKEDIYHHRGSMPNNFEITIPENGQYLKAMQSFKDEYLLDFLNVEELDLSDPQDLDERVLEGEIVRNIRNFIQCLGFGFCFVGNQHRIVVNGEEFYQPDSAPQTGGNRNHAGRARLGRRGGTDCGNPENLQFAGNIGDVITEKGKNIDYNKTTKEKQGGLQNVCYQYQSIQFPE